jgi:hypothetical protein
MNFLPAQAVTYALPLLPEDMTTADKWLWFDWLKAEGFIIQTLGKSVYIEFTEDGLNQINRRRAELKLICFDQEGREIERRNPPQSG